MLQTVLEHRKSSCVSIPGMRAEENFQASDLWNSAILLVEDDDVDIELLRRAFRGARIANPLVEVKDGRAALEYLSGDGDYADRARYPIPFLILLDLKGLGWCWKVYRRREDAASDGGHSPRLGRTSRVNPVFTP